MIGTRNSLWITCVLLCGCGHTQAPAAAASAPVAAPQPQPQSEPAPQPRAAAEPPPVATDSIETFMKEHFLIVTYARDLIIDGDLESLRTPLYALGQYGYDTVAPGGWMKGIAQLQAAAKLTAKAETLGAAARGVATMARLCGQCHVEQGGPKLPEYEPEKAAPKKDRLESRMGRHAWATELMWEGLIGPSDSAWQAGAVALSQAPSAAPTAKPPLSQSMVDGLRAARELGARAINAESADAREKVYGELLVTCADCHRQGPQQGL